MALTQVIVTGTVEPQPGGSIPRGKYFFRLTAPIVDGATVLVPVQTIVAFIQADGTFSAKLWALDDDGTEPTGVAYFAWAVVNGVLQRGELIIISHTMAPTVSLASISPALPSNPIYAYALVSALTAETARAEAAEAALAAGVAATGAAIVTETARAEAAEAAAVAQAIGAAAGLAIVFRSR